MVRQFGLAHQSIIRAVLHSLFSKPAVMASLLETFWKTQDICYAANGTCAAIFGGGCWRTGTPVTGVRFYYSSGTFKTGTLKLYGVK